jgi:hypothetical protein
MHAPEILLIKEKVLLRAQGVKNCFHLYERRTNPPYQDLDYPRCSQLVGLEIPHINAQEWLVQLVGLGKILLYPCHTRLYAVCCG